MCGVVGIGPGVGLSLQTQWAEWPPSVLEGFYDSMNVTSAFANSVFAKFMTNFVFHSLLKSSAKCSM